MLFPNPSSENLSFNGVSVAPASRDDQYYVIHKSNIQVANPGNRGVIPNYMNINAIQNELANISDPNKRRNPVEIKKLKNNLKILAMRRPYYIRFTVGAHTVHFLSWHAPNGGGKRDAWPAFQWLLDTEFEFAKPQLGVGWRFPDQESVIIAGDLNLTAPDVTKAFGKFSPNWKRTNIGVDHILAFHAKRVKKENIYINEDGKRIKYIKAYSKSDHPIVFANVELRPLIAAHPAAAAATSTRAAAVSGKAKKAKPEPATT